MKNTAIIILLIATITGCHNEELAQLRKENAELKTALDSINLYKKQEEEKKAANLEGKVFWSSLGADKPLGELNFVENNKVRFYMDGLGEFAYPYSTDDKGIITIHIINDLSLKFQKINNKQLKLLPSSLFGNKQVAGVIYNCQN
jgi:hypothetical protein